VKKIPKPHKATFHDFLQNRLGTKISPELLPHRLRILGHVAILWLNPQIIEYKNLIGQTVLEYDIRIKSVLRRTDAISGPYRQPAVELIAGSPETETVLKENKVIFHLDPMKVMFSSGNKAERLRMSQLGSEEFVIDMFAGIGQFSIPMAVHARPRLIHAIEWNPDAFHYLSQNVTTNKVSEIVHPHLGDTVKLAPELGRGKADRVIMGLIQGTAEYLKQGIMSLKLGGIMHIHEIGVKDDLETKLLGVLRENAFAMKRQVEVLNIQTIKTYNPRLDHFVLDVQITRK
jgi:tRNA wybutosine-synthesizing protein 2